MEQRPKLYWDIELDIIPDELNATYTHNDVDINGEIILYEESIVSEELLVMVRDSDKKTALYKLNIIEFEKLNKYIDRQERVVGLYKKKGKLTRAETVNSSIGKMEVFLQEFSDWFIKMGFDIPIIDGDIDSDTEQTGKQVATKLKQKDAFSLLKKLENNDYEITPADEEIINHDSFKRWRSDHIKKLVKNSFDSVFSELDTQGVLTHGKFFKITNPPSDWYKPRYIESFAFHCNSKKWGKYYEKCKNRKFEKKVRKRTGSTFEDCFILR